MIGTSTQEIKIQKFQRIKRRQNYDPWFEDYRGVEPYHHFKSTLMPKLEKKMGYGFNMAQCQSEILREAGETFQNKMDHYYGKNQYVRKKTAQDKRNVKEKYNIKIETNPILKKWKKVENIIRLKLLQVLFLKDKRRKKSLQF